MKWRSGNAIRLLRSGTEFFPALIAAIGNARTEVRIETYIFRGDHVGNSIAETLIEAARRGVKVRVLVDGFGSRPLPSRIVERLRQSGVDFRLYRPEPGRFRLRRHRLRRLHRKLACVDGEIAFCGGINIISDFDAPADTTPRFDYAVEVRGPLARDILRAMRRVWRLVCWTDLKRRPLFVEPFPPAPKRAGTMRAALVQRSNLRHRRDIEREYLRAIRSAKTQITLASAYFLPGVRLRRALAAAAERGVRVRLLLQGRPEYRLVTAATRALYGSLLVSGVEIHEYRPAIMHAKVAVVDTTWATVGSSNLDPFSLFLSREANVVVRDESFSRALLESLDANMSNDATQIHHMDWKREPLIWRTWAWLAYGFARLAMLFARYPLHDGVPRRRHRKRR